MKARLALAFAIGFGLLTVAVAKPTLTFAAAPTHSAIPIPMCNPDDSNCNPGGPGM